MKSANVIAGSTTSAPTPGESRQRLERRKFRFGSGPGGASPWLFLLPALLILTVFSYYPLIQSFRYSLVSWNLLSDPQWVGSENYRFLFESDAFRSTFVTTAVFTALSVVSTYVLATATALAVRRRFKGVRLIRTGLVLPVVIPMVVAGLVWRWMLEPQDGIVNTVLSWLSIDGPAWLFEPTFALASVVFVAVWRDFGIYMLVILGGLLQIPGELEEAAKIDGASRAQQFWHVTRPLLRPANIFVLVLLLFNSFKAFDQIWVMTQGGPGNATTTLVTFIYTRTISGSVGVAAAAGVVLFLVIVIPISIRLATMDRT